MTVDANLLIVGSGFYGATVAERIASAGKTVVVIDRRPHIGGNAFTDVDVATGIERHVYGAHLFHTSSTKVWNYIRRFSEFTDYKHRVYSTFEERVFAMPINLHTICQFYGRSMTPGDAKRLIERDAAEIGKGTARNLEEKAISLIGRPLYEAFIRDYTRKQWQVDPRDLPEHIITRLPVRYNYDNRYFNDTFEGLPVDGYTRIFEKMLSHPRVEVRLGVDYFDLKAGGVSLPKTIFTGPIDRFYEYREGALGWRTVDFDWDRPDVADFQGTSVMNYADMRAPWTRIIEFKHFYPQREPVGDRTLIAREYSRTAQLEDEPYYPIGTAADKEAYRRYRMRAEQEPDVRFGGRLGTYKYLDMHQAIGAALNDVDEILPWLERQPAAA